MTLKLRNKVEVTAIKRSSKARVIKNTEIGDILSFEIAVREGGGYQPDVTMTNERTGETVRDRMTLIAKSLDNVKFEEVAE